MLTIELRPALPYTVKEIAPATRQRPGAWPNLCERSDMGNSTSDSPQEKRCSKCRESKPVSEFNRNRAKPDGRANVCRECMRGYQQGHYQRNRATALKAARDYYTAHRETVRARHRAYDAAHKAKASERSRKWYERHPGRRLSLSRVWRGLNRMRARAAFTKHQALQRGAAISDFTAEQWAAMKAAYGHCCAYCHKPSKRLEQDHVLPLSRGGNHTASNIVPACRTCNASKHDKTPEEWRA